MTSAELAAFKAKQAEKVKQYGPPVGDWKLPETPEQWEQLYTEHAFTDSAGNVFIEPGQNDGKPDTLRGSTFTLLDGRVLTYEEFAVEAEKRNQWLAGVTPTDAAPPAEGTSGEVRQYREDTLTEEQFERFFRFPLPDGRYVSPREYAAWLREQQSMEAESSRQHTAHAREQANIPAHERLQYPSGEASRQPDVGPNGEIIRPKPGP